MKVAFVVTLSGFTLAAGAGGGCGGSDNTFIFDDAGSSLLGSSSSGGQKSEGGGNSGATQCQMTCAMTSQCQAACGTPAAGWLFCCDTTASLCYGTQSGSCALVGVDSGTTTVDSGRGNGGDAATGAVCTTTASCGGGQVCCLRGVGGMGATCQRTCANGRQLCATDADCPQNQTCTRVGGGLRTCQ